MIGQGIALDLDFDDAISVLSASDAKLACEESGIVFAVGSRAVALGATCSTSAGYLLTSVTCKVIERNTTLASIVECGSDSLAGSQATVWDRCSCIRKQGQ